MCGLVLFSQSVPSPRTGWLGFPRTANVVGEHIIGSMFTKIRRHLTEIPVEEGVGRDDRVAEFSQQESHLWSVLASAAVIVTGGADVAEKCQPTALLEPDLAGAFPFGQPSTIFAAAPEDIAGDGRRAHSQAQRPAPQFRSKQLPVTFQASPPQR